MVPRFRRTVLAASLTLAAFALASPALAGPPLLCHPFDIGSAVSLPWSTDGSWASGRDGYDVTRVVSDTAALLTPATPVLVRMETLRRAAIYASRDPRAAAALMAWARDRVAAAERAGRADALAYLDAAYVTEAFREISYLDQKKEFQGRGGMLRTLVGESDGYALVAKSLAARPGDPTLEFAAALIAADKNRAAYEEHARKARAGADRDALLARNIRQLS
jgi:hypothetical protein